MTNTLNFYADWAEALTAEIVGLRSDLEKARNEGGNVWQPIETAPLDGSRVLLFQKGRGAFEGWWSKEWPYSEHYWMDDADSEPSPTHWRPLLAAPGEASAVVLQDGDAP